MEPVNQNNEKENQGAAVDEGVFAEEVENAGEAAEEILQEIEEIEAGAPAEGGQQDRLMRLMADFDNFRRRSFKEREKEYQRGRREAVEKLLPVYDSVAMGLMTIGEDSKARTGLEAIQRQVLSAFEQLGIEKIPTVGEEFDPEVHEAIARMPSAEHGEGVVCQESRAGFRDENGLLRAAQVLVSAGNGE